MKNVLFIVLAIVIPTLSITAQTVYVPNGTSGIGSSSNGNVGIGIVAPVTKFHVMGNSTFQAYEASLTLKNQWQNIATGNVPTIKFNNGSLDVWKINAQVSGAEEFSIARRDWSNPSMDIKVLSIKHNEGIVGIGTDNLPLVSTINNDFYRLYVKGGIKTEEIKVELCTGSWCDYVFEENYELTSLAKVEKHIKDFGHLHKTPSAETLEEEGLELKSMTINQQEKIEEIFLHLIELEKQNKTLLDRVEKLESEKQALEVKLNK